MEAELFRQKLHLAAAVLDVPFVRQLDLGAAAKSAFRGKSERRSVQHRLAGNDSFKRYGVARISFSHKVTISNGSLLGGVSRRPICCTR